MRVFLADHWLAVVMAALAALTLTRRWPVKRLIAAGVMSFAVGGMACGGVRVDTWLVYATLDQWLMGAALAGWSFLALLLFLFHRWSYRFAVCCYLLLCVSFGAKWEAALGSFLMEAWRSLLSLQFLHPWWLLLLLFLVPVVLFAKNSLAGLGKTRSRLAILARCAVVACLAAALAEPRFARPNRNLAVIFVIDRSLSIPQEFDNDLEPSRREDLRWRRIRGFVEQGVSRKGTDHRDDLAGVILFGKRPKLAMPPSRAVGWPLDERMAGPIDGQLTDIASALKLAMASFPEGTNKRIVLVSDGNENRGRAEEQAVIARDNKIQIDTVALAAGERNQNEVLVQAVEAPRFAAEGSSLTIRVLVRNAHPAQSVEGLLSLKRHGIGDGGETVERLLLIEDNDPKVIDDGRNRESRLPRVRLQPGINAFRFYDTAGKKDQSSYSYRSEFLPLGRSDANGANYRKGLPGDRMMNNGAGTVMIARSGRKVLLIDNAPREEEPYQHLTDMLNRSKIATVRRSVEALPVNLEDFTRMMADFDCIILANLPAESLSTERQEAIRACVHDQGVGLVMIGGPDAYGPGGYQGTPVEAALPVNCEIDAIKAASRGGLVLIMHACEMQDGNKWEKEIAKLAINKLSPNDMVGIMAYGFGGTAEWVIPFQTLKDKKSEMRATIDKMDPGDMMHFDPFLTDAVDELIKPEHALAVKHIILISDGDPQYGPAGKAAVKKMIGNQVSCTTIGVATHSPAEGVKMAAIAEGTKDGKGQPGRYYSVTDPSKLPQVYIKESRRISQSFVDDREFAPALRASFGPTDEMRSLPKLKAFVRTSLKTTGYPQMVIEGTPVADQRFPVLATWQYGLGKAAAFTSDARTQPQRGLSGWDRDWPAWENYQRFWEQTVRWAMRAEDKGNLVLQPRYEEGKVRIRIDAREGDRPVGGLDLKGGVTLPNATEKPPPIAFRKVSPGVYEAEFAAEEAGSYFITITGERDGKPFDYARTGLNVPYSQEFADLESRESLLKQLSAITGGNAYSEDAQELESVILDKRLFRPTPETAKSVKPFWPWMVFLAAVLLLLDIAVRRVSFEWADIRLGSQRHWQALREPRREAKSQPGLEQLQERKRKVIEAAAKRFEPVEFAPPAPPGAEAKEAPKPPPPPPKREEKPPPPEDMLSQLKRAKKRADHNRDEND